MIFLFLVQFLFPYALSQKSKEYKNGEEFNKLCEIGIECYYILNEEVHLIHIFISVYIFDMS